MSSLPEKETVETDRQTDRQTALCTCIYVLLCVCVCVCVCGVCIPTVRLRPAAERGSANIQTLNTLHCTTAAAAAAAAGLLSYVRERDTHTLTHTSSLSTLLTHTHSKGQPAVRFLHTPQAAAQPQTALSLSLSPSVYFSLSRSLPLSLTCCHSQTHNCAEVLSVDRLICSNGTK